MLSEGYKPVDVKRMDEKLKRMIKNNQIYIEALENACEVYRRMLYGNQIPDEVLDTEFEEILHELLLEKQEGKQ
tara:strand:+ start:2270 stop:2491 length:222 start_codon:yes stop_codon:yes gene_type:complete